MKKAAKVSKLKTVKHNVGDKHFIDGIACVVRYLNAGQAWAFPELDDKEEPMFARHIAMARIDNHGKVTLL